MMICLDVDEGLLTLSSQRLGTLDLRNGYVVRPVQIGYGTPRPNSRRRALNDGEIDDSKFAGGLAVTMNVIVDNSAATVQQRIDTLRAYLNQRERSTLRFSMPGSPADVRAVTDLRCEDAPLIIDDAYYPQAVVSFRSPHSTVIRPDETCVTIVPSAVVEAGRHYAPPEDQFGPYHTNVSGNVSRQYASQLPVGGFIAHNEGTAFVDWRATVFAEVTDPSIDVNGTIMSFDQNGGLTLTAGQTLTIDTRTRSVLINGDPSSPVFDRMNYLDWEWEQLQLAPGDNLVRFFGTGLSPDAAATLCWYPAWV